MNRVMRVLVGVDGSAGSFDAVRLAARLLSGPDDRVCLYYSPPKLASQPDVPPDRNLVEGVHRSVTEAVFNQCLAHLPERLRRDVETVVGTQDPRSGLLVAADRQRVDMIVVGARGAGPLKQSAVGSVARSVVHDSTIPVLIARSFASSPPNGPLRVLLAHDRTEVGQYAAEVLCELHWPADTVGRVMTVTAYDSTFEDAVPKWLETLAREGDPDALSIPMVQKYEESLHQVEQELASFCLDHLPANFQGNPPIVAHGHAAEQILATIEAEKASLVVVGARQLSAISRFLLGSTSEQVVSHAPCSVLVVRIHEKP